MRYKQSLVDPCLYFAWGENVLAILVAWVDNAMILGHHAMVEQVQKDLDEAFTCKWEDELTEYVGSKLILTRGSTGLKTVKFMQLVLV